MKIKVALFLLLSSVALSLPAQPSEARKKILFLIPFYTQDYTGGVPANVRTEQDIKSVNSFLLMGFWAGAQIALEEYDAQNTPLDVVVKDVTEDEAALRKILDDEGFMRDVDLIIGPFFSRTFRIAADYAKRYRIPIVNPFTNRTDILDGNEYVFKVTPSMESKPISISYVAEQYPDHKIILYRDSASKNQEQEAYRNYFNRQKVPFREVYTQNALLGEIAPGKKNIVLTFTQNTASMLMLSRDLLYKANPNDLMLVVPETWLRSKTYDMEYYSKLNLHFFSNFHVDGKDPQTQVFEQRFLEKFKTRPTLDNYAYQGYDITRFFVELARNNGDVDRVKNTSVAFPMSFEKTKGGGYENVNINFLEVRDDEVVPVRF